MNTQPIHKFITSLNRTHRNVNFKRKIASLIYDSDRIERNVLRQPIFKRFRSFITSHDDTHLHELENSTQRKQYSTYTRQENVSVDNIDTVHSRKFLYFNSTDFPVRDIKILQIRVRSLTVTDMHLRAVYSELPQQKVFGVTLCFVFFFYKSFNCAPVRCQWILIWKISREKTISGGVHWTLSSQL